MCTRLIKKRPGYTILETTEAKFYRLPKDLQNYIRRIASDNCRTPQGTVQIEIPNHLAAVLFKKAGL